MDMGEFLVWIAVVHIDGVGVDRIGTSILTIHKDVILAGRIVVNIRLVGKTVMDITRI
jgi:hypothetical protein